MALGNLNEKAAYWAPLGRDGSGRPIYGTPVEIDCRWEDTNEQFINAIGEEQMSQAIVYVDRDLELAGMLRLGKEVTAPADPALDNDSFEIQKVSDIPNLPADDFLKRVML